MNRVAVLAYVAVIRSAPRLFPCARRKPDRAATAPRPCEIGGSFSGGLRSASKGKRKESGKNECYALLDLVTARGARTISGHKRISCRTMLRTASIIYRI